MSHMKYKLDGINAQRDEIEEKMCEHEIIAIETVQNETHIRKKKLKILTEHMELQKTSSAKCT